MLLQIPIGKESSFNGVIDIVGRRVMYWDLDGRGLTYRATDIPNEYKDVVEGCCGLLIDSIVEFDKQMLVAYLGCNKLDNNSMISLIRLATISGRVLVICGIVLRTNPTSIRCNCKLSTIS